MQLAVREQPQQFDAPAHRGDLPRPEQPEPVGARLRARADAREDCRGAPRSTSAAMATPNASPWDANRRADRHGNRDGHGGGHRREADESAQHRRTTNQTTSATASRTGDSASKAARERRAALAAAKVVPQRPDMAGDRRRGAAHREPVARDDGIRGDARNRESRQPARGEPALADVDDDGGRREAEALGAQRIGAAGVAAAHGADVDAAQLPDRERADDRAQQVGDQDLEAEFQHQARNSRAARQEHLGEHAAHAPAAEPLDGRDRDGDDAAVTFERRRFSGASACRPPPTSR